MKLFGVLVAFSILVAAVCESCNDTMGCTSKCTDGYHEQCIDMTCKCPSHSCKAATDCPQGNGSGCPPFCTTKCQTQNCICEWPGSHTKMAKY